MTEENRKAFLATALAQMERCKLKGWSKQDCLDMSENAHKNFVAKVVTAGLISEEDAQIYNDLYKEAINATFPSEEVPVT